MTLDDVAARLEISRLMALYNTAGDTGRVAELASVFADQAVLEAPGIHLVGRDNIVKGLFSIEVKASFVRHHLSTSSVSFTGSNTANGRTYFQVITDIGTDHTGVYTDKFSVENGDWKLAHRMVSIDFISRASLFFPSGLIEG